MSRAKPHLDSNRRELASIDLVVQDASGGQETRFTGSLELYVDDICVHTITFGPYPTEKEAWEKAKGAFDRADKDNRIVGSFVRVMNGGF